MAKKKVRLNACGKLRRHRPYTNYGERIAALGTQQEIADVLGIKQTSVSMKLQGKTSTTLAELEEIANHYDMPLAYFFDDGPCDLELYRVEERIISKPGPLRDLAKLSCPLSSNDHETLFAIAKVMVIQSVGR
jgi:transcriptional regulator with XRE-family HTH domain